MIGLIRIFETITPRHLVAWLTLISIVSIVGKLESEGAIAALISIALIIIAGVAVISPWFGLLALFPLSFGLNPTPETVGLREMAYAALCIALMLGTMVHVIREGGLRAEVHKWRLPLVVATLFLALNFTVASRNGVPLHDWARGLVPFVFLLVFWPVSVLLRAGEDRLKWLGISLLLMALLFIGQVLAVFFAKGLYNPVYYLFIDGSYVETHPPLNPANPGEVLGPFYLRVTTMVAQSTDALLPVTFSVAYVMAVLSPSQKVRHGAFVLTWLAATSILATQTRSMLLSALLAVGAFGLSLMFFKRSRFNSALAKGIVISGLSVCSIFTMNLDAIWHNRLLLLYNSLSISKFSESSVAGRDQSIEAEPSSEAAVFANDVNVMTRLAEYNIAMDMFRSSPFVGVGLGNRHEIVFETFEGEKLVQKVGYVHNWLFYFLMVGGILGAGLYGMLLVLPPIILGFRLLQHRRLGGFDDISNYSLVFNVFWVSVLTMGVYALFFAVFRLISFNLVMAAGLGVCAYILSVLRKRTK